MPPFADAYSDEEIAAVSNYVIGHFGGKRGSGHGGRGSRRRATEADGALST